MKINVPAVRQSLKAFDFRTLFREHLGWDNHHGQLDIPLNGSTYPLSAVAQKRGFVVYVCPSIPDRPTRLKIDHQVTKSVREHLIVYMNKDAGQQVWQWVRREKGKPLASRDHRFDAAQSGDPLIQRLETITVSLDEDEKLTIVDVAGRAHAAFDVEKITKQFYERFKTEHTAFQKFIKGIKEEADLQWYTSLMLNRMMFVYFIQKKGFLDGDTEYLRNRMKRMQEEQGKNKFVTFYRYFLLRLFHDGLGKPERSAELDKLLGTVPYLNGGFFEVHQLEEKYTDIDIPDKAFEKLFDFFDYYRWNLDEREGRDDRDINPDVVGYIFEKYINQKQMGAYYTKEDITDYISKNAIIPFLFDAAERKCPIAFKSESYLWQLLKEDPDRYIYPTVKQGVIDDTSAVIPLPASIAVGVEDTAKRDGWNKPAVTPFALPTETWREYITRRNRCLALRQKLAGGEVHGINDFITLNLDIWQFARDAITSSEGPELLRAFWHAIEKMTCLDPTCGSGAFLFAALRILESLYSDCLERMEQFVEDLAGKSHHPEKFSDFKAILEQIARHPNQRYFILKNIIINNLFGVDIMEEAVEICKLRLFLKLVAQVESAAQIEPLPDIDFNIRAGNTLVGYSSFEHVEKTMDPMGYAKTEVARLKEDLLAVECIFKLFREQQTKYGGNVTAKDKKELRKRLGKLDLELDRYLAGDYAIDANKKSDAFDRWRKSHQPFHWFVEFYGIMREGGFNVIIGNPPYLERSKLGDSYSVKELRTLSCRDIYAWVVERACTLRRAGGEIGLIVPVSIASSGSFNSLRDVLNSHSRGLWLSHYANRPGQLFVGAQNRLTIALSSDRESASGVFSTRYHRWDARRGERDALFSKLTYASLGEISRQFHGFYPKTSAPQGVEVLRKMRSKSSLGELLRKDSKYPIYWVRVPGYFCQFFLDPPQARPEKGGPARLRGEVNCIRLPDEQTRRFVHAILNSSTWYTFFCAYTDCRHINPSDVTDFPLDLKSLSPETRQELAALSKRLEKGMRENTSEWRKSGLLIESVDSRPIKSLLDEIDVVMARHFGFTDEELDWITCYDIKYRLGTGGAEDDED